jgi:hypothetical protein
MTLEEKILEQEERNRAIQEYLDNGGVITVGPEPTWQKPQQVGAKGSSRNKK